MDKVDIFSQDYWEAQVDKSELQLALLRNFEVPDEEQMKEAAIEGTDLKIWKFIYNFMKNHYKGKQISSHFISWLCSYYIEGHKLYGITQIDTPVMRKYLQAAVDGVIRYEWVLSDEGETPDAYDSYYQLLAGIVEGDERTALSACKRLDDTSKFYGCGSIFSDDKVVKYLNNFLEEK